VIVHEYQPTMFYQLRLQTIAHLFLFLIRTKIKTMFERTIDSIHDCCNKRTQKGTIAIRECD